MNFALLIFMVRPKRFELLAFWFVAKRSIQLSYGRNPCTRVQISD